MKIDYCASAIVINPVNKKILLVKHNIFNKWVQPGGHIEQNESPEEAAIRETYEETSIKIKLLGERFPRSTDYIRPLSIQKNERNGKIHLDFFYIGIPEGSHKPIPDINEVSQANWFTRKELDEIDVFPDIKITMDYILDKIIK